MSSEKKKSGSRNSRMTFHLTAEGIADAIERDSSACVIADAIRSGRPDLKAVSVDLQAIRFTDPETGKRYVFFTPIALQQLLVDFDQGKRPEPQSFYLGEPVQIVAKKPAAVNAAAVARKKEVDAARAAGLPVPPPSEATTTKGKGGYQKPTAKVSGTDRVVKHGGELPPTAAYSNTRGRRRIFGAKGLKP